MMTIFPDGRGGAARPLRHRAVQQPREDEAGGGTTRLGQVWEHRHRAGEAPGGGVHRTPPLQQEVCREDSGPTGRLQEVPGTPTSWRNYEGWTYRC